MRDSIAISMIGISGSGKTMTLSGVYEAFMSSCVAGSNGAVISATGSRYDATFRGDEPGGEMVGILAPVAFERYRQKVLMSVQDKNGKLSSAAAGTVEMSEFVFDWDVTSPSGIELSQPIKWTDYRGGILSLDGRKITDSDIADCKAFMGNLQESEVILILIDGIKLAQNRDNASLRKEKTGADRINALMNAVMKNPNKGVTVSILVTKVDSDKIPADLKSNNYQGLCKLACDTIDCVSIKSQNMTRNYNWNFSVIPVSAIGENNSVTNYIPEIDEYYCAIKHGADVHQKNIDAALIYCIKNAMTERCNTLNDQITECDAKINSELSKMGIFNTRQHKESISHWTKEKNMHEKLRKKYISMLTSINEGYSNQFAVVRRFGVAK